MHERLNSYAEFLEQPQVRETGLIHWLDQAGVSQPVPGARPARHARRRRTARRAPKRRCPASTRRRSWPNTASRRPEIAALLAEGAVATASIVP